jgi:hypothetical protein
MELFFNNLLDKGLSYFNSKQQADATKAAAKLTAQSQAQASTSLQKTLMIGGAIVAGVGLLILVVVMFRR